MENVLWRQARASIHHGAKRNRTPGIGWRSVLVHATSNARRSDCPTDLGIGDADSRYPRRPIRGWRTTLQIAVARAADRRRTYISSRHGRGRSAAPGRSARRTSPSGSRVAAHRTAASPTRIAFVAGPAGESSPGDDQRPPGRVHPLLRHLDAVTASRHEARPLPIRQDASLHAA